VVLRRCSGKVCTTVCERGTVKVEPWLKHALETQVPARPSQPSSAYPLVVLHRGVHGCVHNASCKQLTGESSAIPLATCN
jgi:hypothetical protein